MIDINEVIYGLEFTKAMITFNPSTGEDIEPENLNEDNKITYDACVGAIALLKKQEAVKPNRSGGMRPGWWCGACNYEIGQGDKYCKHCGQAVKWNDYKRKRSE